MNWSVGKGAMVGFIVTVAVLLASGWASYRNIRQLSRNEALVVHTHEVLDGLRDTLTTLTDAESGQRGYIITGESAYMEPYRAAIASVHGQLDRLKDLTSDNPAQERRVTSLMEMINARVTSLGQGIATRDKDGAEGGRQFLMTGRGKQEMDAIRVLVAKMENTERDLLVSREAESRASYRVTVLTVILSAVLGLALVGTAYWLAAREIRSRQRGAEALHKANEELERRVQERTADLGAANESLQRSNRELEQFASVASHDLQEPLRKIQAFGDRLQTKFSEALGEQGREYIERMQASATRMRNLIDALLSFSRVTTKAQPFVPVDLAAIAQDVLSDLEDRVQRTGGRVDIGPLPTVEADPLQMRQLLQNLVANGLKFHRQGQIPVVAVEARLQNNVGLNGETLPRYEISVRDNGIGFEEVYLDRIFELFQRLHGRQEYEGTGMGLAICRKIVERHGGAITATSAPDRGATFLVTLPIQQQ